MTLVDLGRETITKRIDAKQINENKEENGQSIIIPFGFLIRGKEKEVSIGKKDTLLILVFPKDISARKPDELDFFALTDMIKKLKRNGVETIKWEVTRYLKISFAFTNLIAFYAHACNY